MLILRISNVFYPISNDENLLFYDINSQYPHAMMNPMPVGYPIHSTNKDLKNLFGFVFAKIIADENVEMPILPVRNKNGSLITPRGEWTGWYFSEELKNAEKYGYKIDVIESYLFEKGFNVFNKFVKVLYELKKYSNENERIIYKIILNSLYGRFRDVCGFWYYEISDPRWKRWYSSSLSY